MAFSQQNTGCNIFSRKLQDSGNNNRRIEGDESAAVTCPTNQPFAKSIRSPSDALAGLCVTQNRHGSSWELLGNQSSALSSLSFLRLPIFLFVNEQT